MIARLRQWSLIAVPLFSVACGELAEPLPSQPQNLDVFIPPLAVALDAAAPDGSTHLYTAEVDPPPEFDDDPAILEAKVEADLTASDATGVATMRFFGNAAEQTLRLLLYFDGGAPIGDQTRPGAFTEILPGVYSLRTAGAMSVSRDCGHKLEALGDFKAWHEYGGVKWGSRTDNRTNVQWQPSCPDVGDDGSGGDDGGSGGGGSGGGGDGGDADWVICYGTAYFDENGQHLYTEWHYCEDV